MNVKGTDELSERKNRRLHKRVKIEKKYYEC